MTTERQLTYLDWEGWSNIIPQSVKVAIEKDLPDGRRLSLGHYLRSAKLLRRTLLEAKPDILHVQESFEAKRVAAWLLATRKLKCPLVLTIHDPTPHPGEARRGWERKRVLQSILRKRADRIVTTAEENRRQILSLHPSIDHEKVAVVPHHSLDYYLRYRPQGAIQKRGNLLFFGRMVEYKGIDTLVEAWPIVRQRSADATLTIAGFGDALTPYLDTFMKDPRVCVLHRRILNEEAARLFTEAEVVLLPYKGATQSGVIAAAVAFGRACVASDVGAISEMVEDRVSALLVPPGDSSALATAVLTLLSDDALRSKIEREVVSLATDALSPDSVSKLLVKEFEVALDTTSTHAPPPKA